MSSDAPAVPNFVFAKPLRSRQLLAIEMLLQGKTETQVCNELKIRYATMMRWKTSPAWVHHWQNSKASYGLTNEALIQRARRNLILKGAEAIDTIDEIRKTGENERNRLSASIFEVKSSGIGVREQPASTPSIPVEAFVRVLEALAKEPPRVRTVAPAVGAGQILEHRPTGG